MSIIDKISRVFLDEKSVQQYFTVSEQVLFSAASMIASIVVVANAGVSWFGIYSFMFTFATLGNAFISTLVLRQMTLEISTLQKQQRQSVFLATLAMMSAIFLLLLLTTYFSLSLFPLSGLLQQYQSELIACELFVIFYSYYDATRQYMYVIDHHQYSFKCTLIYALSLISILILILFFSEPEKVVHRVFLAFSFSTLICLILNTVLRKSITDAEWINWGYVRNVFERYFKQSRFRLVGLAVNWTQNQSFNPLLMLIAGPLVAGYFSLARLLVMPMSVVNQGLMNSSMPNLRRAFKNNGNQSLVNNIIKLDHKNLIFSGIYISGLIVSHVTGILSRYIPDYASVQWFLLIWIMLTLVTVHRFWIGQFFIVRMQFKYMMEVALFSLAVSLTGMLILGIGLGKIYAALSFAIIGELVAISFFKRERKTILNGTDFVDAN